MPGRRLGSMLLVAIGSVLVSACNVAEVQLTNTPVPSLSGKAASFDVIEIDQNSHRLYVSDRTDKGIDVFDISSASAVYLQTVAMPSSPNGLAIAPDLGRLFVGTSSGVVIVDISADSSTHDTVLKEMKTEGGADLLAYASPWLFASSNGSIAQIDPKSGEVKKQLKIGHPLEQPRYNPADGKLYVTSPGTNALLQIDINDGTIAKTFLVGKCQPGGLAISPRSNQALLNCASSVMSVDLSSGKTQVFAQITGGDVVSYDAKVDRFFVAAPKNKPASAVGIFGGNPIAFITSVVTSGGGNSAAYDETNGMVYTPDRRPNSAGITSFRLPPSDQLSPAYVISLGILATLTVFVALVLVLVARSADPIRRRVPEPKAGARQPSPE